jgi:hypothetical protein
MKNLYYKIYLSLHNNKLLDVHKLFVLSYNVNLKQYFIWYVGDRGSLKYYDCCDNANKAKFKWNILMCRGVD